MSAVAEWHDSMQVIRDRQPLAIVVDGGLILNPGGTARTEDEVRRDRTMARAYAVNCTMSQERKGDQGRSKGPEAPEGWTWGGLVSALRTEAGLAQEEFGELFGVNGTSISKWERGFQYPSVENQPMILHMAREAGLIEEE